MILELLAIICLSKSRKTCCLCIRTKKALRFILLADFAELLFTITFLVGIYFVQDTQMPHIILALVANVPIIIFKIFAYCPLCCNRKEAYRECYYTIRVLMLIFWILAVIGQMIVSILAIQRNRYYDDLVFGYCTFCYKIAECEKQYELEMITVKDDDG